MGEGAPYSIFYEMNHYQVVEIQDSGVLNSRLKIFEKIDSMVMLIVGDILSAIYLIPIV